MAHSCTTNLPHHPKHKLAWGPQSTPSSSNRRLVFWILPPIQLVHRLLPRGSNERQLGGNEETNWFKLIMSWSKYSPWHVTFLISISKYKIDVGAQIILFDLPYLSHPARISVLQWYNQTRWVSKHFRTIGPQNVNSPQLPAPWWWIILC